MIKDQTILDRMIDLSIEILKIKLIQTKIRHLSIALQKLKTTLSNYNQLTIADVELSHKREDLERTVAKYAEKYFPQMLGFNEDHAHFTLNELKSGKYQLNDSNYLILAGKNKGEMLMEDQTIKQFSSAIPDKELDILTLLNIK